MNEKIKQLTDSSFEEEIKKTDAVLVDFYADWCGPCQMMAPVLDSLSQKLQNKVVIAKIDSDSNSNIASTKAVYSVPTLILFKKGQEIARLVGFNSEQSVLNFLKSHLETI
jgi:thioredoxin 1